MEVDAFHAWEEVGVAGWGQQPQQTLLYLRKEKEVEVVEEVKLQPLKVVEEVGEEQLIH